MVGVCASNPTILVKTFFDISMTAGQRSGLKDVDEKLPCEAILELIGSHSSMLVTYF